MLKIFGKPKLYYQKIKSLAKIQKTDLVLDVGGGTGVIANYMAKDAKRIVVLDPSEKMLRKIKSRKIEKVLGKAQKIKYKNGLFDIVYCVDSFHHFTNGYDPREHEKTTKQCIRELLRVLKKGGKLIIIEFDPEKVKGKCLIFLENKIMGWRSKFYKQKEFLKLFEKENVIIKISKIDSMCYIAKITKK